MLDGINAQYQALWRVGAKRSLEPAKALWSAEQALYLGPSESLTPLLPLLPEKIEEAIKAGRPYRVMDAGSGSYASLFTGMSYANAKFSLTSSYPLLDGVTKKYSGLSDKFKEWGFTPGRDFELIAVHGGEFAVPQEAGLSLVTTNFFDGVASVQPGSIDLLIGLNSVYHTRGALFLVEYFDSLLRKQTDSQQGGVGIVWPVEGGDESIIVVDQHNTSLSLQTLFQNQGPTVNYWDIGSHLSWTRSGADHDLQFPVHPFAVLTRKPPLFYSSIVYQLDKTWEEENVDNLVRHKNPGWYKTLINTAEEVTYF